jgi:hypothetical protein
MFMYLILPIFFGPVNVVLFFVSLFPFVCLLLSVYQSVST